MTLAVPWGSAQEAHTLLSIESDDAVPPVTCHDNVTACPEVMVLGEAVRPTVNGTFTVTIAGVALPPGPDALMVKVVVAFTTTTDEPEVDSGPVSSGVETGGVMVTEVALAVAQVMVAVCPPLTAVGVAVNVVMVTGPPAVTCTVMFCGAVVPPLPLATAV